MSQAVWSVSHRQLYLAIALAQSACCEVGSDFVFDGLDDKLFHRGSTGGRQLLAFPIEEVRKMYRGLHSLNSLIVPFYRQVIGAPEAMGIVQLHALRRRECKD